MKRSNIFYQLVFSFFLLNAVSPIFAQDYINEDFLDNIEANVAPMWNERLPAFDVAASPEKYKDQSGVVIGYRRSVNIDKQSRMGFLSRGERSLVFLENVRFKMSLGDKSAVDAFSTIYFRYSDKTDGFSAKVIKPGGLSKPVALNEAVEVEGTSSIPEFFKSFFDKQSGRETQYYKVAIPDLEPGDIIEYVTVTKSKLNVANSGYIEFTPQYEICTKNYPILFNQIIIETDEKSHFKSMSFNGAPEFRKEAASESGFFRYIFTDSDRPTEKDVNFINRYKQYPLVKFQVIYANSDKVKGALVGERGEIKTGFSKEELARKAWEDYAMVGSQYYGNGATIQQIVDALWADLKKLGAPDWSEADYIRKAYYRLRNLVVNRDTYLSDKVSAFIFGSLLYKRDISSELIISISNDIGTMKDILFDEEIRYVVKVNDKLFFNCTDHSNPGELVESLLGCEAYIIAKPDKKGNQEIKLFTLPSAGKDDNQAIHEISSSIGTDMNTITVTRTSTYRGISKARNIENALRYTTYMLDDYKNHGGNSPTENMNERQEEEYFRNVKAIKDNFKEAKPEYVKSQLESEFGTKIKSKGFTIASSGRTYKATDLSFTEDFEIGSLVRKAGKKYLVNVIGLVAGQLQIKKDERERKHDISMGYPRSNQWTIRFRIPDGYTVDGLSDLNMTVENEVGFYQCKAEQADGQVVLRISKQYKQTELPKSKWNEVLAFVDAAYNNAHRYILLRPKS